MTQVLTEQEVYRTDFESLERRGWWEGPSWLADLRRQSIARFVEQGFPTLKEEEWKYTNVSRIARSRFQVAVDPLEDGMTRSLEGSPLMAGPAAARLVFVNGHFARGRSSIRQVPTGAQVGPLSEALATTSGVVEAQLGRAATPENGTFIALNTAFWKDGPLVYLPRGAALEAPIHVVFLCEPAESQLACYPRTLIILEKGAHARVIETYLGDSSGTYLTNAVTEAVLGDGAVLEHCKVLAEGPEALHVATTQVQQQRESSLRSFSLVVGGALARNDLNVLFDGDGASCALDGVYVVGGEQHVDNHTRIDHAHGHCTSRQLYKGVLGGSATAVFNGKIIVRRNAQGTDAEQTNKNLLLSEAATVDTKPQLEIFADDVRCTHGAAVGQLEEDALFYAQSRGLDREDASALLAYGFAAQVIGHVAVEPLGAILHGIVMERIRAGFASGEMA